MRPFALNARDRHATVRLSACALCAVLATGCGGSDQAAARQAAADVLRIQQAASAHYQDSGAWPTSMAALRRAGHLPEEPRVAPWGQPYRLRLGKRGLAVLVDVDTDAQFEGLRRYFVNSQRDDRQVAVPLFRPRTRAGPETPSDDEPATGPNSGMRSNTQRLMGQ